MIPPECSVSNSGRYPKEVIDEDGNREIISEKCDIQCEKCNSSKDNCSTCS